MRKLRILMAVISVAIYGSTQANPPATPSSSDETIKVGKLCTAQFPAAEKKYKMPSYLMAAISNTESGRWDDNLAMPIPWPWAVKVDGDIHYFHDENEAVSETKSYLDQPHQSVAVGCMQIDLKQNQTQFKSLSDAFDPKQNVQYAAALLGIKRDASKNWIQATGAYHSDDPKEQKAYLQKVEQNWNLLVDKIKTARASKQIAIAKKTEENIPAWPIAQKNLKLHNYTVEKLGPVGVSRTLAYMSISKPEVASLKSVTGLVGYFSYCDFYQYVEDGHAIGGLPADKAVISIVRPDGVVVASVGGSIESMTKVLDGSATGLSQSFEK